MPPAVDGRVGRAVGGSASRTEERLVLNRPVSASTCASLKKSKAARSRDCGYGWWWGWRTWILWEGC